MEIQEAIRRYISDCHKAVNEVMHSPYATQSQKRQSLEILGNAKKMPENPLLFLELQRKAYLTSSI